MYCGINWCKGDRIKERESGEEREEWWVLVGNLKKRDHLEDLGVDDRLLKWALKK